MWLPPDLLELCRAITDSDHDSLPINTHQSDIESDHHTAFSTNLPGRRNQSTQHGTFPLLRLPMDILAMHLPLHLPYDSLISIRLSNRDLYTVIPAPKRRRLDELNECERKAVLTAVEEKEEQYTRRCCVICRSWYPVALFAWVPDQQIMSESHCKDAGHKSGERHGAGERGAVVENRVCRWHRARFERAISRMAYRKDRLEEGWTMEEACMHCGGVLAWDRCGCKNSCPSCWKRNVWCYTRIVD